MGERNLVTLGELADIVTGTTPSSAEKDSWGSHLDFITPASQQGRELRPQRWLSPLGAKRLERRIVPAGSTALGCIGAGSIGMVGLLARPAVTNQQINSLIARPGVCDSLFLYYMIKLWSPNLRAHASGSATPIVNKSVLANFEFTVPDLRTQRSIGEVLGAIDDKIVANDRAIATATELARSLFRRAAAEGVTVPLGEVTALMTRGAAPKYVENDGLVVLNQKCVRDQWVSLGPSRLTATARPERVLVTNDVLVNSTGQGTLGRVARWTRRDVATVDSHITIVRFDSDKVEPIIGGYALLAAEAAIELLAEGSTGQTELKKDLLAEVELRLPARDTYARLAEPLAAWDRLRLSLVDENERLAATRDELLPLLVSGKLRVKDAVATAEGAL